MKLGYNRWFGVALIPNSRNWSLRLIRFPEPVQGIVRWGLCLGPIQIMRWGRKP